MKTLPCLVLFASLFAGTVAVAEDLSILSCDATCQSGFVTEHNRVRTRVNNGLMPAPAGFQPVPTPPLAPVSWDAGIATGSQSWSDLCNFAHSGAAGLGENLYASAGSVPTPATAVSSWEGESTSYTYAAIGDPVNNQSAVGHYTQLVWSSTSLIGCGISHCTTNSPFLPNFIGTDPNLCVVRESGEIIRCLIGQYVSVGEEKDSRLAGAVMFQVPTALEQLPGDLKGNECLAGSGGQRQEYSLLVFGYRRHCVVDGDLLIISGLLCPADIFERHVVKLGLPFVLLGKRLVPKLVRRRESRNESFGSALHRNAVDLFAIGCIGKIQL